MKNEAHNSINQHSITQRCLPYLLSALLLGLSYPSYPYVRLEVLAWVWMTPMIFALKSVTSLPKFLRNVYLTLLCVAIVGMSWLSLSTVSGALLLFLLFPAIVSVPFVVFYFVRRSLGWRAALLSLPVVWTAWDWLYQQTEGSLGWVPIGVTQSNLIWLVQYADITGVWGITFWLVLFNVLIVMAIDGEQWSVVGGLWSVKEVELKTENSKLKTALVRRLAMIAALMLVPPLAYAGFVLLGSARASSADEKGINVLLVQPDVNPWDKLEVSKRASALARTVALTNKSLARAPTPPELIIWPETAVPFAISESREAREMVYRSVSKWQTPLLAGLLDRRNDADSSNGFVPPTEAQSKAQTALLFNGAALFSPKEKEQGKKYNVATSDVYHKRVLMPFVERVPYVDVFPALQRLAIQIGAGDGITPGSEATVLSFRTRQGEAVKVGTEICYEALYPKQTAELVKNGAQVLAFITNEGWFSQTHGEYQLAAFSRLRSIETRRATARAANTGITWLTDSFGRVQSQAPWWSEQALQGNVKLSNEMSFYVRHIDLLPKACAWASLGILVASLIHAARQTLRRISRQQQKTVGVSSSEV